MHSVRIGNQFTEVSEFFRVDLDLNQMLWNLPFDHPHKQHGIQVESKTYLERDLVPVKGITKQNSRDLTHFGFSCGEWDQETFLVF